VSARNSIDLERDPRAIIATSKEETRGEARMQISAKTIMPCLWFDTEAEAAAKHYVSIFPNSKLGKISRYGKEGKEIHGKDADRS